ncbi:MAG: hypothetical protein JWR61_4633 [Ferruginibacter sp.]|nr:hypothetical protein [Ferruginibacter sp.]
MIGINIYFDNSHSNPLNKRIFLQDSGDAQKLTEMNKADYLTTKTAGVGR